LAVRVFRFIDDCLQGIGPRHPSKRLPMPVEDADFNLTDSYQSSAYGRSAAGDLVASDQGSAEKSFPVG
jgi:hypothetical protein